RKLVSRLGCSHPTHPHSVRFRLHKSSTPCWCSKSRWRSSWNRIPTCHTRIWSSRKDTSTTNIWWLPSPRHHHSSTSRLTNLMPIWMRTIFFWFKSTLFKILLLKTFYHHHHTAFLSTIFIDDAIFEYHFPLSLS